jgi:hypothetical protein
MVWFDNRRGGNRFFLVLNDIGAKKVEGNEEVDIFQKNM